MAETDTSAEAVGLLGSFREYETSGAIGATLDDAECKALASLIAERDALRAQLATAREAFGEIAEVCWDKRGHDALRHACEAAGGIAGEAEATLAALPDTPAPVTVEQAAKVLLDAETHYADPILFALVDAIRTEAEGTWEPSIGGSARVLKATIRAIAGGAA